MYFCKKTNKAVNSVKKNIYIYKSPATNCVNFLNMFVKKIDFNFQSKKNENFAIL